MKIWVWRSSNDELQKALLISSAEKSHFWACSFARFTKSSSDSPLRWPMSLSRLTRKFSSGSNCSLNFCRMTAVSACSSSVRVHELKRRRPSSPTCSRMWDTWSASRTFLTLKKSCRRCSNRQKAFIWPSCRLSSLF